MDNRMDIKELKTLKDLLSIRENYLEGVDEDKK